jgi:hypothetical protein
MFTMHVRRGLSAIWKEKRIVLIPSAIMIGDYLWGLPKVIEEVRKNNRLGTYKLFPAITQSGHWLRNEAMRNLWQGLNNVFSANLYGPIFEYLLVSGFLLQWLIYRWLRNKTSEETHSSLRVSMILLWILFPLFWISQHFVNTVSGMSFPYPLRDLVTDTIGRYCINVSLLLGASVVQAYVISLAGSSLGVRATSDRITSTVRRLPTLYSFNALVIGLASAMRLLNEAGSSWQIGWMARFPAAWLESIVAILAFPVPLFVVLGNLGLSDAIRSQARLIFDEPLNYVMWIVTAGIMFIVVDTVSMLTSLAWFSHLWFWVSLWPLVRIVVISTGIWFQLSFLDWLRPRIQTAGAGS